jgi:hypothetical protein
VEKLDLGPGIWAYRFSRPSGPLWVLWYDGDVLYFPGETPASVSVALPFAHAGVLVTRTPTEQGVVVPETERLVSSNAMLTLVLDSAPIFVEIQAE